jgi:hypothetical protein
MPPDPSIPTVALSVGRFGSGFVAVVATAYRNAKRAGVGRELPTDWFLEDIRD